MRDWHIGQKVVCVDAAPRPRKPGFSVPKPLCKGQVYTIREIETAFGKLGFRLDEVVNETYYFVFFDFVGEGAYLADRFRPLVTKEADISQFTAILDRVSKGEVVD